MPDHGFRLSLDGTRDADIVVAESREMPPDVHRELVTTGFVHPPRRVMLLIADVGHLRPAPSHRVKIANPDSRPPLRTDLEFKLSATVGPASQPE
jgi:hypothetical protein